MAWLGVTCKEAGSKWSGTLAVDVPWADLRVHGGRGQGSLGKSWLHSPASGPGLWCPGLGALLRGIHSATFDSAAPGPRPSAWHVVSPRLPRGLAHHVHSVIRPRAHSAEATDMYLALGAFLRWGERSGEDQQSLLLWNWHLRRSPPRVRKV